MATAGRLPWEVIGAGRSIDVFGRRYDEEVLGNGLARASCTQQQLTAIQVNVVEDTSFMIGE
jgi:hypothetical protein